MTYSTITQVQSSNMTPGLLEGKGIDLYLSPNSDML